LGGLQNIKCSGKAMKKNICAKLGCKEAAANKLIRSVSIKP
jgi:hypothetical protein